MSETTSPVVNIREGTLQGTTGKNLDGVEFLQFLGIPYAKPPIGELRFKPPQPVDPWEGVKDATKEGSSSISRDDLTREIVGTEDCLYLNVYTSKLPNQKSNLRPVMVFIHGGGFRTGSSRPGIYGPEFLLTKDVVLVTVNYRLGILGFLGFDDPTLEVYGNMGLKDQNLALKWVQKNISHFNGDPNNVTFFGESAGGASVQLHMLSPASKGLFHKTILQSGWVFNHWFWGRKNNARNIVKQLQITTDSEKEALDVLRRLPAMEIFKAQERLVDTPYPAHKKHFSTVIETPHDGAFLSKSPVEIMKEGSYTQVPTIMGYNDKEGMSFDVKKIVAAKRGQNIPDFEMRYIIPSQLNVPEGSADSKKISEMLDKLYSNTSDDRHHDEITDGSFFIGLIESLRYLLKKSKTPIYLYRMSLAGKLNHLKNLNNKLDEPGVCHADDIGYLFHSDITPEVRPGSLEDRNVRNFVELWTNFAEYGNPTPNDKLNVLWEPVTSEKNIKLLDIGEKLVFKDIPERDRLDVWWKIFEKWPIVKFE